MGDPIVGPVCGEQHPDHPDVRCQSYPHRYGQHWARDPRLGMLPWPGNEPPPKPPRKTTGRVKEVIIAINEYPPNEPPVGPPLSGDALKGAGIKLVVGNAPDWYKHEFRVAYIKVRDSGNRFTVEDITDLCPCPSSVHLNTIGGMMSGLVSVDLKAKVIILFPEPVKAREPRRHSRKIAQYQLTRAFEKEALGRDPVNPMNIDWQ